ncbi:MAG: type IX secretion system sortase PorU [Flavobacteriales bacterium]|nr:type IX secretion system sortase PorU [Flavobacteriales bacterium]MBT3964442.1 type IX secretion system sortase PorU [Flavobacteriales bacterium]MBT4705105.1 type IX secretion system sortase PorU [Flavobacteriales bacterium]MBT4930125.1 type IX secretion system sortase PorU [Flavobacteriales bacterium]MBT5133083.1 type IX secretion system sortase PorU [Flavobacteriales bacterium]
MRFTLLIFIFCTLSMASALAQSKSSEAARVAENKDVRSDAVAADFTLEWTNPKTHNGLDGTVINQVYFEGAGLKGPKMIPYFVDRIRCAQPTSALVVQISNSIIEKVSQEEAVLIDGVSISNDFQVSSIVRSAGEERIGVITVVPLRKTSTGVERLVSFDLDVTEVEGSSRGGRSNSWKDNSVLNSGSWYKIGTAEDGIYKVTQSYIKSLGIDVNGLTSNRIRLFGTKGGTLPKENIEVRPDDLDEMSISVVDGNDGSFDKGDYFLFFGEDQVTWTYFNEQYKHDLNPYADTVYYFLTVDDVGGAPNRISNNSVSGSSTTISHYDYYAFHEEESANLIKSGRKWYGEQLGIVPSLDFGFTVPEIDVNSNAKVISKFVGRSVNKNGTSMRMALPNQGSESKSFEFNSVGNYYGALHAREGQLSISVKPTSGNMLTKLEFDRSANTQAQAWIDYVEINARRKLSFLSPFMSFRDAQSIEDGQIGTFQLSSTENVEVWDVTTNSNIQRMVLSGGVVNGFEFDGDLSVLREYVAFNPESALTPVKGRAVSNQNLHALANIEYVIVAHPAFLPQAERLAEFHEVNDGLTYAVITPAQIYNEFSGGAQDVTAIKEFMRMLYHEADSSSGLKPRYLLLFGDGSYDYKDRVSGNSNFVPTYQTKNSLTPTGSIATDDYYGLMDDDEGEGNADFLDFGIGRLTVRSKKEADDVLNKIINYADNSRTFGEWRNWVAYVADDADPGDGHTFMRDCDGLADLINDAASEYNISKLYMDSYRQETGSGGERYPEGSAAITQQMEKGALMMYYIGHGGELGWAHERILEVSAINKWENLDNLPLLITATCEFSRFDDPRRTSAGEYALLNPSGGSIALLSTTRAVYASPNLTLSTEFTLSAFDKIGSEWPTLGEIMMLTKVNTLDTNLNAALNSRTFALLGDPALRLAYPELSIVITDMPDTVKALDKVKVKGFVADFDGSVMESFNGLAYPTVFDKIDDLQTLNNDGVGVYDYKEQRSLVFKGKSSVINGEFEFEFVVPKDIKRPYGFGKVSLYAENGTIDANGAYSDFVIGGLSDNPIVDEEGPQIDLYMNDNKFIFGGLTDENPDLYAEVWDDNGINMVGTGIGHDITAVLDKNTSHTLVLNDYYEANVDSYQGGKVIYPFNELQEGKHSLRLQLWDVNNNPADAFTEFVVANSEDLALEHVLNYPNPFTTNTDFYFEHNKPGQNLDVRIEVFTVSGKLVKTLDGQFISDGFRVGPINWNGLDEYNDLLGKGVYLYKVKVKTQLGEVAETYERLVLLN